ncbi:hypothetical protein [Sphingopyxis sp. GW247-27LB]|uniref:DUF7940 domain-containing protein n=1 Tax=Sphingopyxis sp. GW247-27LB TaxID=2012632 RepID=UPI000BA613B0|nr:hypothetical protein [Sphingopyxis sp. GW247-27LB]PAL23548.1 hypothetical protein CD928_05630 [Sphingopyxis sp. GW247-27LB]
MTLPHCIKTAWKRWSVRLNAIGLAILAWVSIDPSVAIVVLNMMPDVVREFFPAQWIMVVSWIIYALYFVKMIVKPATPAPKDDTA